MRDFRPYWKTLARNKRVERHHTLQLCVLKALHETKGNVKKASNVVYKYINEAFSPVRRSNKLTKGGRRRFDFLPDARKWALSSNVLGVQYKEILTEQEMIDFTQILLFLNEAVLEEYHNRKYVYVFTRQDISPEYQLVQSAHATLVLGSKLALHFPELRVDELYFAVIGVPDLEALHDVHEKHSDIDFICFNEPDLGNQVTSMASYPIPVRERRDLLKYKRLVF